MSTIKSSNEHLTLNADGSSKDIKFQANGVEVGSLSSSGVMTATTFTGAATDTTKLPLAGGTMTGDLNVNSKVNIQDPSTTVTNLGTHTARIVGAGYGGRQLFLGNSDSFAIDKGGIIEFGGKYTGNTSTEWAQIGGVKENATDGNYAGSLIFKTRPNGAGMSERMRITADGRGLSQFTAKAWVNFNGANTVSINDSHNVSSITDNGTGNYSINFSNNMANTNYSLTSMSKAYSQYGDYSDSFGTFAVGSVVIEHREGGSYTDAQKWCGNIFGD